MTQDFDEKENNEEPKSQFVRFVRGMTEWAWSEETSSHEAWGSAMLALRKSSELVQDLRKQLDSACSEEHIEPSAAYARRVDKGTLLYGVVKDDLLPAEVNDAIVVIRPRLLAVHDRTKEFNGHSWMNILQNGRQICPPKEPTF